MKKTCVALLILAGVLLAPLLVYAMPNVYPTGVTVYKPDKAWNGYTVFPSAGQEGAVLIDMNGNVVRYWKGLMGEPGPNRILPGGFIVGGIGSRKGHQEYTKLVKVDWNGNTVWSFDRVEEIKDKDTPPYWSARQHHDWQMEGLPTGYYVPGMNYVEKGKMLVLAHKSLVVPKISDKMLEDDLIVEIDSTGKIIWQWLASDHIDEMGFDEAARKTMYAIPNNRPPGDWIHINNMNYVGPNRWFDQGDQRFNPENIIADGRETNTMFIIEKKTGKIVWRVGPDYTATPALQKLGVIIGMHNAHMIPNGLPGAGNILVFDNGGNAGYGPPNPGAPTGFGNALRGSSRVLEFDPLTLEIKWQYTWQEAGFFPLDDYKFFSQFISNAQRLPNGNTLITEGADGRILEVTKDHELVWEYVSPFFTNKFPGLKNKTWNLVYRSYRVPYEWVPQAPKPTEKAVTPPEVWNFQVPGSTAVILPTSASTAVVADKTVAKPAAKEDEEEGKLRKY